ncbi:hypothetical protein COU80_00735 [Candidatus Peregrinibacteria bacterium CG10_big_fil_rev_8_21_14_0_10_55_24]|nr:MAG: hypothetical protein COU80_00735 [Candidatus Peregrinibacteria bacterium CG10_big_fil_rev_8_21_14_0_10_55_24]
MTKKRFTEDSYRKEPWFRALCSAMVSCKSEEQMADLLRDVGTLGELQSWSERLEVAKLLAQGLSYREVAERTGASTTTVTRVARFIENGPGGYRRYLGVSRTLKGSAEVVHHHADSPRGERTASVLQGYLDRAQR